MSALETFAHSQPVREARRRETPLAPHRTCYCKTPLGSRPGGGVRAPPAAPAASSGWGTLRRGAPVAGVGLPEGSGRLVPINVAQNRLGKPMGSLPCTQRVRQSGVFRGWRASGCWHGVGVCRAAAAPSRGGTVCPSALCRQRAVRAPPSPNFIRGARSVAWPCWILGCSWCSRALGARRLASRARHRGALPAPQAQTGTEQAMGPYAGPRCHPHLQHPGAGVAGSNGCPSVPAGCRVSVGARGRSPEQPAP